MLAKRSKKQNLEVIKIRLQVRSLPIKFKELPANAIALFADHPELDSAIQVIIDQNNTIKNANGRRLDAENQVERLKHKLFQASQDFINPSKSEIIQGLKNYLTKIKSQKLMTKFLTRLVQSQKKLL
ncbi:MAG: hypothetical protein HC763_20935 [Hydrococcus sp. CRU_1_1]|nr:hypothetical protein [Hydrococcus sp. CRU_1_1]